MAHSRVERDETYKVSMTGDQADLLIQVVADWAAKPGLGHQKVDCILPVIEDLNKARRLMPPEKLTSLYA